MCECNNQSLKSEILPVVTEALERCLNYNREAAIDLLKELKNKLSSIE